MRLANTEKEWESISDGVAKKWNIPNCIGDIDGKHIYIYIYIDAVPHHGSYYLNYKKRNNIVMMALLHSNRKFIYIDIGGNGRVSDGGVFNNTALNRNLEDRNNSLNIPNPKALPIREIPISYFIVADDAFPPRYYIMKPYPFRGQYININNL